MLAYLASARPDWLKGHLQQMLELMLLASAVALSPAKRYRLRCAFLKGRGAGSRWLLLPFCILG